MPRDTGQPASIFNKRPPAKALADKLNSDPDQTESGTWRYYVTRIFSEGKWRFGVEAVSRSGERFLI